MLISLQIENFALVDRLELELGTGLNVLTGETGAGKSIVLDALDAALGGKVNSRAIRTGADRASIEATFDLDPALINWLGEQQIELVDDMSLICTRELTAGKGSVRSRSRINGVLVNKQQMEQLRDRLLEITAQGQTMLLGQPTLQREWLDAFGGADLIEQREVVSDVHMATQQALKALEKRRQFEQQRLQQLDIFEYQAKELSAANLGEPDELDLLEQERQRLSHSVELQQQSYQVYQALYQNDRGSDACADLLGQAESVLTDMLRYDAELQPVLDLVSGALAQVEEAGRQINNYGDSLETDPDRLQEIEERIIQLKQICRKYGPTLAEVIAHSRRIQQDLEELSGSGQSLEVLEKSYQNCLAELTQACERLTQMRQKAAQSLEALLVQELKPLAMDKVQFKVGMTPIAPTATGADRISFLFSPNPGEPLQPLTEIASGGEMSRFLLALKACFSQVDSVGTMVFDEIDVGVSGRVAQAIADKLHQLSRRHQVLCVTHQPIIAAMADAHYRVNKEVIDPAGGKKGRGKVNLENGNGAALPEDVRTVVRVLSLDDRQRREELAQLAGGKTNPDAIAFADSLLAQAAHSRLNHLPTPAAEPTPKAKPAKAKASRRS
ncbi:DNA repair protein RecN [Phormidium tenue FACHB-886]|nr:DNA repair protein RecN [Phormidium tenue FACHB-886]